MNGMGGAKIWVKESWLRFSSDNFLQPVQPTTCQPSKITDDQQGNIFFKQGNMVLNIRDDAKIDLKKIVKIWVDANLQISKMNIKEMLLFDNTRESKCVVSKNSESQASVELVANVVPFGPQATCNSRQNISKVLQQSAFIMTMWWILWPHSIFA